MKVRWDYALLVLLILLLFWMRLALSTSVDSLSYQSYTIVRGVETIQETFLPLSADPLSYLVPQRLGSPLNQYILAVLSLLGASIYKIWPNLLSVLLLVPVFLISFNLTKSKVAALISAILTGTGPWVFSSYLNTPSAVPLAILLFVLILYLLNDTGQNLSWILGLTIVLTFLHPIVFVLVFSFLAILILLKLERFGIEEKFVELFFFTLLLALWFNVLIYKEALFLDGINILWRNLPSQAIDVAFGNVGFLSMLYGLGVITFLFGSLGVYHALFESRMKSSFPIIGATLAVSIALLLRVIELKPGFFLLTILMSIMAGHGLLVTFRYIKKTKAQWVVYPAGGFLLVLFIFTALLPALSNAQITLRDAPSAEDIRAFEVIEARYPKNIIILTSPNEAAAVQYYSNRTTLMDPDYLLVKNADELIRDIDTVYRSRFTTRVIGLADKWHFDYILFSNNARQKYLRSRLAIEDSSCLPIEALTIGARMYEVSCTSDLG